jgi:fibronectin-binding autotransporter adhesin
MVDPLSPEQGSERRRGPKALRKAAAVLLATTALGVVSAHAVDGTWVGGNLGDPNEWTEPANWTSNPAVPDGTATFTNTGVTGVDSNGIVTIGSVQFTGAPNAQAYTITTNDLFLVNGTGIFNNSTNTQTFNTTATTIFQNSSTASGGSKPVTYVNSGFMLFQDSSTAGTAIITNNSSLQFINAGSAGSANITNNAQMDFSDATSAGSANITNAATGLLTFNNTSTANAATITLLAPVSPGSNSALQFNNSSSAGGATISTTLASFATIAFNNTSTAANANIQLVDGTLAFNNSSTAGSATVTMTDPMHPGSITFNDNASAGSANITNVANVVLGTSVQFLGASTAGSATITNNPGAPAGEGGTLFFGTLGGTDTSNAGTAHIINNQFGSTSFLANTSAASATITNNSGGNTNFQDQSTAASATIVNNSGGTTSFGIPSIGTDTATAGTANITNHSGGTTQFNAVTDAGNATITNDSGGFVQFGTSGGGDTATALNSTITSSGTVSFNASSTAGSATITTNSGGNVFFFDTSSGGAARFITNAGGTFDISALSSAGTTAGSIEGAGNYFLGSKNLAVGSNNLSTTVSGVISDGGTGGGVGGSLTKVGTGTLILTGANTYTGDTTITAGSLQLGNGGGTGSIAGNVVDNSVLVVNRSDPTFIFAGVISGSGALNQVGPGTTTLTGVNTYTGATTISAGTLALSGAGSIANSSGVVDNAIFDISGTTAGASIKNLSGAGIATLGSQTLTLTNASGTFAGAIGGTGGLIKQGAGLFILSGTNTYTGATTVAGGDLRVNGSVASAVTVQSGATLSGIGSVGGLVTVQSGGTLSAGQSPGTITLGALNLNAGSTSVFELGSPGVVGGPTNDLVNVTGNLTLGGTLSVNAPSAGYYRLFNYGTLTPSNFATITGSTNGNPVVLTNVPNQVNLSIAAAGQRIQFWDGADQAGNGVVNGGTGTWNAANTNWTGAPGQATINDQWRSSVGVFSAAAGTVTIAGTQAFDTLQFSTTGYVLNPGAGGQLQLAGLSGTGTINTDSGVAATINAPIVDGSSQSLTKVGGGTLILTAANTYSGDTTISGGTLQLGNGGANGSIIGNVINNSTFAINRSDAFTFGGVISGSGAFKQIGTGSTTLTAIETYSGLTTISAGTLALTGAGSIANSSGVVANSVFDISGVSGAGTSIQALSGSGSVALGAKTLTLTNASGNFAGSIGGSGGVTLAAGTQTLSAVNGYTGATTITAGTLALTGAGNIANSSGVVANGVFDVSGVSGASTSIKSLSGFGSVALDTKTLTLTNASGNFAGSIGGSGGVTLAAGTQILSGINGYTGATTITAGTLALAGAGSIASSNGVVANGTFDISGTTSGAAIQTLSGSGIVTLGARTLTLTNASGNFAGSIGGTGGFTLAGGTETLSGSNTYTGPTTVTAGTLAISAAGSITSNVTSNATFNNAGTVTGSLTNAGTASNTGIWNGNVQSNTGTINNNLTWTGTVSNTAGTFNNNAPGTVSGLVTNAGTTTNSGTLNGGLSNTAGTTTNTGTINGGATVSGGTLNTNAASSIVNGGLTNSAAVNAQGQVNGAIVNQGGGTFNVAGNLAGNSSFTNNGTAQLLVNGGNFTGITTLTNNSTNATGINVAATRTLSTTGTVTNADGANIAVSGTFTAGQLLTNSGVVLVNSGGTLNATVGGITNTATGTITVALGGTVNDDLANASVVTNNGAYLANVASNTGAGSITNTATGTWAGNVVSNAAAITNNGVWTGNVVSNAGTINNNLTWTGTVSNAGTFNNNAGATVSGLLTNTAGSTVNNGALNGGATISGGAFTGSGTVANLNVSGGTFAPGNGTPGSSMTVTGNLAFQSGAMYLVTLNPTTASFASVGGTASLNGTAAAVYLAGNYISKKYTILTAAGGVSGTFGSLVNTNVPANFTSSLSYDANNAYINLTLNFVPNPAPNFGGGLNINQQNVANTLVNFFNTTGGIPLAFGALTPTGLTLASGELGTGIIQSAIRADDMFLNLLLDPSVAGRAGGLGSGAAASQFADDDEALAYAAKPKASPAERDAYAMATKAPYLAPQPVNRWSIWGAAYGGSASTDGNAVVGSHNTTARAYGVVGGADYKISPDALVGFALAGGGTNYSLSDALGTGRSDLFQAGVFGRQNIGAAYLSAALAYGWYDVTTNRTVALPAGDVLQARFKAETFSGRFEGGYRFATPLAGITPYVAAQVISFNLPAYAEQVLGGPGTFALNYAGQTTTATRTELGLRTDKAFAMQDGIFTLRGRAAWAHDYNSDRTVTAVFQTLPGAAFVVNGARANPDGALVSAGAEMKWLNGFSLAATFEGEFSSNTTSYAGKGIAKYSW